ncbi:SGNH hydrolase-type esterase domain-containing protein [Truncatella angustata]|uniref:SGNH hydrolase-type esterase domain-containing protein n=1 Tax=Truncatella angustata TaxID=152316 RepID=A0A9P8ZZN8_9PEZI|nr:SGNH hydrolase-type esterase domain-containing protein [Truncatella angustata]KAH6655209.1 SGNH hydrolase-type esterase domain-containing protein [Truncatella angustata]
MRFLYLISLLPLTAAKYPSTAAEPSQNHTVWLCGDSTMAPGGGHNGTEGFGQYLHYSFDSDLIRINNSAYAGRSARTFTREGRFQAVADKIIPGDWVVIEFGHNDAIKLRSYRHHSSYNAQALKLLGADVVNAAFPMDNTHTSPYLADVFAKAFVLGLKCGTSPLQAYVVNATSRIQSPGLGSCLSVNDTLPI